ncbi:hypothetical protein [Desemzia sp. FAM 24101]
MSIERDEMSDEQWNHIKDSFPKYRTGTPKSNRPMSNTILWIAESGAITVLIRFFSICSYVNQFFFNKLKQFLYIAAPYDKLPKFYLAFIYIAII